MEPITCSFTEFVQEQVDELPEGLIKKIEEYKEILMLKKAKRKRTGGNTQKPNR